MVCGSDRRERLNLFALVVYIPHPLSNFLDELRRQLVPGCRPRAHITILPPRPLDGETPAALACARTVVTGFAPFRISAGEVEIFDASDVIYIDIRQGERELREMYRALNRGPLGFTEPFPYYPHITLAQDLTPEQVTPLCEIARKRWAAFRSSRSFRAERACFVQSNADCTWVDLAEFPLAGVPVG